MKVICRTNLDLDREIWPEELPALPRVGDNIQSGKLGSNGIFRLTLQVVAVNFVVVNAKWGREWVPEVDLHLGKLYLGQLIKEFQEWYENANK